MEAMEAREGKMEARLRQWGAKIDELVAKAEEAGAEAKIDHRKRIDELRGKYQAAQSKLDELRAAGSEKRAIFEAGVESAWSELEAAFKKLTS